jgi:hypothetical protein
MPFGAAGNLVILFEPFVYFGRSAGRRHKHFGPRRIRCGHGEVHTILYAAGVRDHWNVVCGRQRGDAP